MNDQWFYAQQGQQQGPVPFAELQRLASAGVVRRDDPVWNASLPNWQTAATIAGLYGQTPPPIHAAGAGPAYPPGPQPMSASQSPLNYAGPMPQYGGQPQQYDAATRWLLPVGRSGWAIAAGYLGLLSMTLILAPLAVIFSLIAIRDLKRNPRLSGMGRAVFGLIFGLVFSALLLMLLFRGVFERY